jgi:hypothetical protein
VARESGANIWRTQDGVNWSSVQVASGITLSELGYADGVWLAVASNRAVYRSINNGASWTLAGTMPGAGGSLLKTGGVWLALNGTTIYRSSDNGSTWTSVSTGAAQGLNDMIAGGGVIVAVGNSGEVVSSSDGGASWTRRTSGKTANLLSIAYGNGRYVAVGNSGVVLTSLDGVSWQAPSSGTTSSIYWVAFGNGMFVRHEGDVSADGVAWTGPRSGYAYGYDDDVAAYGTAGWIYAYYTGVEQTVGGSVPTTYSGTKQVIVGESTQYQISSGGGVTSYTALQLPPGMSVNTMTGVISGTPTSAGTYQVIIYGSNANGISGCSTVMFTISNDSLLSGLRWASRWAGGSELYEIENGGGWYVARESGANIWRTQDGVNWSSVQVASGITLSEMGYADGVWLAVASNKVYRSIDNGASWTLAGTMPGSGGSLLKSGGVWLALNGTTVYRSSDNGSMWTSVSTGAAQSLKDMTVGGGVIVAVGNSGEVISSSDGGASWTRRTSGKTTNLLSIAYGNGRYVAVGNSGVVLTSLDGVSWQAPSSGTTATIYWVAFGNGMFVRSGGDVSADGVAWTDPQIGSPTGSSDDLAVYGSSGWIYAFMTSVSQTVGGSVPTLYSGTKQGIVGESAQYQITSSGGVTSYMALQLPPGMSLNTITGVISGTPTTAGTYQVIVYGSNDNGISSYKTVIFTISN